MFKLRHFVTLSVGILTLGVAGCTGVVEDDSAQDESAALAGADTLDLQVQRASADTLHISFGYLNQVFIACAPNAPGEFVTLQGRIDGTVHTTIDGQGRYHISIELRAADVSGIGETTGTEYRLVGSSHHTFTGDSAAVFTVVDEFKVVGPGPKNDGVTFLTQTYTVSANGELSPSISTVGAFECR